MFSVKSFGIANAIDERNGIRERFPFTTVNDAQELTKSFGPKQAMCIEKLSSSQVFQISL